MAGNPVATVKQTWLAVLDALPALDGVQCSYSYPGDAAIAKEALFFAGAETTSQPHSLKAGRSRREITCEFDVIVEVRLDGKGNPTQQAAADARADAIALVVDEHIADEKHLSSPSTVTWATVVSSRLEQGYTDQGVAARVIMRVRFHALPL